jgi:hypothetical protein
MGKRSVGLYCEEGVWGLLNGGIVGAVDVRGLVEGGRVRKLEKGRLKVVLLVGVVL